MENKLLACLLLLVSLTGCRLKNLGYSTDNEYAKWFKISEDTVFVYSPYCQSTDTLIIEKPLDKMICMSTSYIAYLDAIDATDALVGVSGKKFISNDKISKNTVPDIGYDADIDYETIINLNPDILITYTVSGVEPQYIAKLRKLGIRVLVLYDQLEDHPLGRTEYVRLFGTITGKTNQSDSVYSIVKDNYLRIKEDAKKTDTKKCLLNTPYSGIWYVPGKDNYMSKLVNDAGGEILGSKDGSSSSTMTIEQAYLLSKQADFWLNVGDFNSVIKEFEIPYIYSNDNRTNRSGGNDFWESGAFRSDLILQDLYNIFSQNGGELYYYKAIQR